MRCDYEKCHGEVDEMLYFDWGTYHADCNAEMALREELAHVR